MHTDRFGAPGGLPDSTRPSARSHWERYRDRSPELVKDHDFRSEAKGRAIPYGIYDPQANTGTVWQHRPCNRHGLRVTVAHYPTAASKWNPIEHRLFCEISKNWPGRPLHSFETILKYLRTTRTAAGSRAHTTVQEGM